MLRTSSVRFLSRAVIQRILDIYSLEQENPDGSLKFIRLQQTQ